MALFVMPSVSGAAEIRTLGRTGSSTPERNICSEIKTMQTGALARLDERANAIGGRHTERRTGIDTKRAERMKTLMTKRSEHEATRAIQYAALRARASTTEQKAAVETFTTAVETLVTARKAAVDAAIKSFEDGVAVLRPKIDTATIDRKTQVKADLDTIFNNAEAACTSGKTGPEVRAVIQAGMEAMRTKRTDTKGEYSFKDDFEALRATRKAAEEKAQSDFKTGFEIAKTALKTALVK